MFPQHPDRDSGIDALRGLAIAAMIAAHLSHDVLDSPHPLWLRAFGSLAAPLFVTLAGLLAAQTMARKNYGVGHYLRRGLSIVLLGALVDMLVWHQYPLVSFDVLYLIGVALPLIVLFVRWTTAWQLIGLVLFLGTSELLRNSVGYPEEIFTLSVWESPAALTENWPRVVQQVFISGWFPLFPWLFFAGLGATVFRWRQARGTQSPQDLLIVGITLLAAALFCSWLFPAPLYERIGYSELFYPPATAFVLAASGSVLLALYASRWQLLSANQPLILLGRCPLLIYVVHLPLIHWGLRPLFPEAQLPVYLACYAGLLMALVALAWLTDSLKRRSHVRLPLMMRILVGA